MMNLTPHASARHWSASLCGAPWQPGADGPEAFDCWGLVRHVQATHFGRELRRLTVAEREAPREQWTAIRDMVQRSPWFKTSGGAPREGDILLMLNAAGLPHVGVVIELPRPRLLHAVGAVVDGVAGGQVRIDAIDQLAALGFGHLECWRHA